MDPFDLPPDVLRRVPLFAELSKVLSWRGGPVNWDLARQLAVSIAASERATGPLGTGADAELAEHLRLAELWLSEATGMPAPAHIAHARAVAPADWAQQGPEAFGELIDPIAAKVSRALGDQASSAMPEDAQGGMLALALGQLAPMFLGIQAGAILGNLATEVLGSHDVALPTADEGVLLVLPSIDGVAADYGLDRWEVRQWVALSAAARRIQFEGSAWARAHFFSLYHSYVASLDVDIEAGLQRLQDLDVSNPERLQEALSDETLFAHHHSPAAAEAAARVSLFLAVVDAHATLAVEEAGRRVGGSARVAEALARRAAGSGKGPRMLTDFVGLDPSDEERASLAFARTVLAQGGWALLNRLWDEPDAFPTPDEVAEPGSWVRRLA